MATALETVGFERQLNNIYSSRGFLVNLKQPKVMSLCSSDNQQAMYIASRQDTAGTYVILSASKPGSEQLGCRGMQELMSRGPHTHMPDLAMPPDTTEAKSMGGPVSSARVRFKTNYSPSELVKFFSGQISEQNWKHESDWANSIGAGSVWSAQRGSIQILGNLQVVPNSGSGYTATFTVEQFE